MENQFNYFYSRGSNAFFVEGINDIPEDAVFVSDDVYEALITGQASGKTIVANENGYPMLVEPKPSEYHQLQNGVWVIFDADLSKLIIETVQNLSTVIDNHATQIYTQWTRFADEYKSRKDAAEAFMASNFEGEPSIYITSFAIPAGIDNKTAALLILQQAKALQLLQDNLAALRMWKYELKKPNLSLEEIKAIYADIIAAMNDFAVMQQKPNLK